MAATATSCASSRISTSAREFGLLEKLEAGAKFFARCGQVPEKFDFAIEMDEEGFVLFGAKNVVEEGVAGIFLLIENAALAEARIDEKAERERQIAFAGE